MNLSHQPSPPNYAPEHAPLVPSMRLAPLRKGLSALNACVAEHFLALAAMLQSNSARAREITAASHKATGSESRVESLRSIGVLQGILSDSAGVGEVVAVSTKRMLDILCHVTATRAPLENLAKMRHLLHTVGVLSKIEGGRVKSNLVDLTSLSTDIDVLAASVQNHVDRLCADSATLAKALQSGVDELNRFEQQERAQAADLIRRTQAVLEPMVRRSEALQTAARDIDAQYEAFHRSTNKVVMSLQSEDIARQRIEHVQEAICRVADSLDAGAAVESCAGVLSLQRAQLVGTRGLLADSIGTMRSAVESLGPRIHELVSRTARLAEQTDADGNSFASVIDGGLEAISTVFKQCSASVKSVLSIVNNTLPQVEQMTNGASELEEIELSIHLISLNAAIKTTHLGSDGVAMGAIANELRSITRDSEEDTKSVLGELEAISEALEQITSEEKISKNSLMLTSGDLVKSEFSGLSQSVRSSSQTMAVGLNEVRQMAEALCAELARGSELCARAEAITGHFDEQLRNFDEACRQLGYTEEMAQSGAGTLHGSDLSKSYSMESERKLHLEIFGGDASATAESTPPTRGEQESSEFGDDVELF